MGLDLRILPQHSQNADFSHDVIDLCRDYDLFDLIQGVEIKKGRKVPRKGINSFSGKNDASPDHIYGTTIETPYGETMKGVLAGELKESVRGYKAEGWKNRAFIAFLNEMPDELKDPNVLGFVTKNGTKVTFNDSTNKLSIQIADSDNEEKIVTDLSIEKNILNLSVGDGDKVTTSLNIQDGKVSVETSEELSLKGSKIQLNNDSEGLPLASKLVEKLNALEKDINSLKTALVTGSPAVVAVAPTFATVQTWASTQQIKLSIKSDIENKEVLQ